MPLIRFTKKTDMVRNHTKTQTIRKPRKAPLELFDTLHVYSLEKLGLATITSIKRKRLLHITLEEAQKDGFETIEECQEVIMVMHDCSLADFFDVIEFQPYWKANTVVEVD